MYHELTDRQWAMLAPLLPPRATTGRPRADDRRTLNGIGYVLRTGCRWHDLPAKYGSPVTCWRRLKTWMDEGTWLRLWQVLLVLLRRADKLRLERTLLDASIVPAKTGGRRSARPRRSASTGRRARSSSTRRDSRWR